MIPVPRIRGKCFQIEEPIDIKDKWGFELSMWDLSGEVLIGELGQYAPFDSEEKAKAEMMRAAKLCCDKAEGGESLNYIDMKNGGVLRPWESHS